MMNIKAIGSVCKNFRIDILKLSLTDFAKKNNENLQNIHAFEQGRANNIKYIYTYLKSSNDEQLYMLIERLFIELQCY